MDESRVTLDGREYVWNGHSWYDAKTFVRPPSVVMRQLDAMTGVRASRDDHAKVATTARGAPTVIAREVRPRKRAVHNPKSGEFVIRLRVSRGAALDAIALASSRNDKFQRAMHLWNVDPPGTVDGDEVYGVVDGASVCWLFCWAKAEGPQNGAASAAARKAFDDILDVSFAQFDRVVDHRWAQDEGRYGSRAKVDAELNRLLGGC